ncbi:hypothetical protein [Sphaerisporangium album]|uniref:hypothetical protein n=1 Tax=Sphaerisporangium album TaxID=509200 RepID=UPI0011C03582|nr:hypothetical protein [Sphaerisporangium album]
MSNIMPCSARARARVVPLPPPGRPRVDSYSRLWPVLAASGGLLRHMPRRVPVLKEYAVG